MIIIIIIIIDDMNISEEIIINFMCSSILLI